MAHISVAGRALADRLSGDTFGPICPELASKLNRAARRYRTVQEEFCNGDDPLSRENWDAWEHKWERKAERLEERIREIVADMFPKARVPGQHIEGCDFYGLDGQDGVPAIDDGFCRFCVGPRTDYPPEEPVKVTFRGDPRGYCVYLIHPTIPGNTWGGDEHGYGVGEGG